MARKPRRSRRGCWIEANRSGLLRLRFRWRLPALSGLHKFSETTSLLDTADNRVLLAKQAAIVGAEIQAGKFDYLRWFPNGSRAGAFGPQKLPPRSLTPQHVTIGNYFPSWVERKVPPLVRTSRARDYRRHFQTYILPFVQNLKLADLSVDDLESLKKRLLVERGLSLKTVRNVIDASLRAMIRDARKSGINSAFPFADVEWPRQVVPGPDPFTEEERDRLLEYFEHKRWRVGRSSGSYRTATYFPYYAFLFTLFYTGLRPSEAVALRIKSLDLAHHALFIERSRSLGAEAAPKTSAAARLVRLTPRNVQVLRQLQEPLAEPDDYVFKNILGAPIEQRSFYNLFRAAQRRLGIRLRDLYATKDTYVSAALTRGVNLTWLSEQTGVADITLRKHYGRFIHSDVADTLELAKIEATATETVHFAPRLPLAESALGKDALIYKEKLVEQKGFEPSTPTLRTWCSPS